MTTAFVLSWPYCLQAQLFTVHLASARMPSPSLNGHLKTRHSGIPPEPSEQPGMAPDIPTVDVKGGPPRPACQESRGQLREAEL